LPIERTKPIGDCRLKEQTGLDSAIDNRQSEIANPLGDEMEIGSKEIPLGDSRVVTFRAAVEDDEQFLLGVYGSTRLEELALTNWELPQREAFVRMQFDAQQLHYRQHYPKGEYLIIQKNGDPVGRLYVANIETEIRIIDITILPERRGAGIGTPIIRELMNEAKAVGKPLRIYVESFNPSRRLFERLGFVKTGESGYNYLLEWRA
jgi:RimJ/RimL family protein N-acetyltransferase